MVFNSILQNKTKSLFIEVQNSFFKKYTYEYISGALNQSLYTENEEEAEKLSKYYSDLTDYYIKLKAGEVEGTKQYNIITGDTGYIAPISIPVPLNYIGVETPIYIKKPDDKDSYVKAYDFNTKCWGYMEVYLPISNIHDDLPPDSLLVRFKSYVNSLPSGDDTFGQSSPYGFYCN